MTAQICTITLMQAEPELPFTGEDLSDPTGEGRDAELRSYDVHEIRRWLKVLCRLSGLTPTQLAKAAGLAPSTLNRFLNSEVKHRLSASTLSKIEGAAAVAYEKRVKVAWGQRSLDKDKLRNFDLVEYPPSVMAQTENPRFVRVLGHVQAGDWREAIEWAHEDQYVVGNPPFPEYAQDPKFALEVRGTSMNKIYPPGTIVLCVPFIHVDRNPVPGEKVLVQRRSPNGMVEATVKEFQIDDHGRAWLWPRSTDPEHQQPLRFEGTGEEDDILVTALVVASIRREHLEDI